VRSDAAEARARERTEAWEGRGAAMARRAEARREGVGMGGEGGGADRKGARAGFALLGSWA
jgi:hypothetical protein